MAGKGRAGCFAAVGVAMWVGLGVVCAGLFGLSHAPRLLSDAIVDAEPTARDLPVAEASGVTLIQDATATLQEHGTVRLTGPELTRIWLDGTDQESRGGIVLHDGQIAIESSLRTEGADGDGWINFGAQGRIELEDGWVVRATADHQYLSEWDLSDVLVQGTPEEVASELNRQLVRRRYQHPELDAALNKVARAWIDGDELVLTVTPDGRDILVPLLSPRG